MAIVKINQFEIGDILQVNLGSKENPIWIRFFNFPLRDSDDIKKARDIVETHGACLGPASTSLANSPAYRLDYRVITDPEWAAKIWDEYHSKALAIDHFRTTGGRLIGPRGDYA